ncbi:MAG: metallophosphoesterase [Gammaproteobacteria bacterium]
MEDAIQDLNGVPIALLSSRWDAANHAHLEYGWKQRQFSTFLHWRDIDGDGQVLYAIRALQRVIHEVSDTSFILDDAGNREISILHISDLQFGGFDSTNLSERTEINAYNIRERCGDRPPDFVVVTGDITERALPSEFEAAGNWLKSFMSQVGIPEKHQAARLLTVPGNHDVSAYLAAAGRCILDGQKKSTRLVKNGEETPATELSEYAFAPFKSFHKQHCDRDFLPSPGLENGLPWVEDRFRHIGVVFYGINTAQPADTGFLPAREVCPKSLTAIRSRIKERQNTNNVRRVTTIGLGHHCPIGKDGDKSVTNPDHFTSHLSTPTKTHIFLHGHWHQYEIVKETAGGSHFVRSCAQTMNKEAGSRPEDTLRGYNILHLERDNDGNINRLRGVSVNHLGNEFVPTPEKKFVWSSAKGGFVDDPES